MQALHRLIAKSAEYLVASAIVAGTITLPAHSERNSDVVTRASLAEKLDLGSRIERVRE